MKKFIALYLAPADAVSASLSASPEEKAEGMKVWMNWKERSGDKILDLGAPLIDGITLTGNGRPYDSKNDICGYSIVQAESKEQAQKLFQDHPHVDWIPEAAVSIHEVVEM